MSLGRHRDPAAGAGLASLGARLRRLGRRWRGDGYWMAAAAGVGIAVAAAAAVEPLFYRYLLDLIVSTGPGAVLRLARLSRVERLAAAGLAGWAGLLLAQRGLQTLQTAIVNRVRFGSSFVLSRDLLEHLYGQPLAFHQRKSAGYLLTRLDRGVAAFGQLVTDLLQSLLPNLANLVLMSWLLYRLSPRLAWIGMAPMPLFLWATVAGARRSVFQEEHVQEGWSRLYARVAEVLGSIKTVKSMAAEEIELGQYCAGAAGIFGRLWRLVWIDEGYGHAKNALALVGRIAVAGAGLALVWQGRLSAGSWMAATSYAALLYGPLAGLAGTWSAIARELVAVDAVFDFLEEPIEIAAAAPVSRGRLRGAVVFERVSFAYPDAAAAEPSGGAAWPRHRLALDDISFRVEPGETVAIIGASGCGKSTLMDLLLRFHQPQRGRILVDGLDLATVDPRPLRRQVAVVLQEPGLLEGTVGENIAYGVPGASLAQVEAAARAAHADEFIARLPRGYQSRLGGRGASLSGGERQRIAIARALLRDPTILILDEATSSLDAGSERAVNLALRALLRGRTAFVISHRPMESLAPDRVLVIHDGRLVECGPPAALLAADGYYSRWRAAHATPHFRPAPA